MRRILHWSKLSVLAALGGCLFSGSCLADNVWANLATNAVLGTGDTVYGVLWSPATGLAAGIADFINSLVPPA